MRTNPYRNYLETEVMSADPIKLVVLLYRGALDAVSSARHHLAAGDIRARAASISKAMEIIGELNRSLDFSQGGSIGFELGRLYNYMIERLGEANVKQDSQALAETERLLSTLLEAWDQCAAVTPVPVETKTAASCAYPSDPYSYEEERETRFTYAG